MTTRPDLADADHEFDQHLRRTLAAVAATVTEASLTDVEQRARQPRRRRRLVVGIGAGLAAIPLAAAAVVGFGPEHVDRVPPVNPIVSGSIGAEQYWIVDGRDSPQCEGHPSGVEVIAEDSNIVGQEWNTVGYRFGEPDDFGCAPVTADEPPANTYFYDGGQVVGDGMLWAGALHPDVDEVRVSFDGATPFDADTFTHEGSSYFAVEVPSGIATFTVDFLVDGQAVVPPAGETDQHGMARG
jgi:hypothetical protein